MIATATHPPVGVLSLADLPPRLGGFAILLAVLALGGLHVWFDWEASRALYGGDGPDPDSLVNCSACGARTPADSPECDYCGASLENA